MKDVILNASEGSITVMKKKINGKGLPSHTRESSPFVSSYLVLIAKLSFIPLLEAFIILRS